MKRLIVVVLTGMTAIQMVEAQVTTSAVPFLLIAPNSRASAMGEGGVAVADDGWAIYWNPAGFAFQTGSQVSMTHANWLPAFNLPDLWIAHMVYKQPVEELDGVVSAGITYLNLGKFDRTENDPTPIETFSAYEYAVTLGYGTKLSQDLGIGTNVRLIHSALAPFGTAQEKGSGIATGFSFDVGLLYKPHSFEVPFTSFDLGNRISFGANLSNIGPKLTYIDKEQADPLPMNLRLGLAYKILDSEFNNLLFITDISRLLIKKDTSGNADEFYKAVFTTWTGSTFTEQIRQFTTSMGMEYWYGSPRLIALRAGYFYEDPRVGNRKFMTFGAGIRYDIYGFDFSYISAFEDQHPLGETLRFSLSIDWGGGSP
jgi:hypothetical protein